MHLQARKQRNKLAIFKKLYRILMIAVVAVAVFFVISTLALSNRADEGEIVWQTSGKRQTEHLLVPRLRS